MSQGKVLLVMRRNQSSKLNTVWRSTLIGALCGVGFGLNNFMFIMGSSDDPSGFVVYFFSFYIFSFLVSLPWSLITIFTVGAMLDGYIVAFGAILNGAVIGATYDIMQRK